MKTSKMIAACLCAMAGCLAATAALAKQSGVHRTDLQRHDISVPGWEAIQVRVDFDPGKTSPNHKHPGEEIIYVLEGTIVYQLEGKPPVTLKRGDVLFVHAGVVHSATNTGKDKAPEIAKYVAQKKKQL